ncbi:PREDICTED: LEAF RUST 10 DISEASE-RESISTANCE LOCUS RECEPTOR-LIKE PROTEIN KINASE-like 1.2 [Nelumbo nucifera]|uniref:non-specific serine/threonine protein kinase n=1 Tax=Nelumbo nucifera TaxID=4432 RepID=A0A1U8ABF5_NELNU|nr:PREDICTED: LEAF RUST 10 DISEASE-RESISTANCE LOCUS RECEPTOR-LIKE PROTEIN KINASE-like 1.2 [Nelumbo nucifera]
MDQNNSSSVKTVFSVLINIIFMMLSTLAQGTRSADPQFEACAPRNCGKGPYISYPFWIPSLQQSYCGLPRSEVTCQNSEPVLKMPDGDYLIQDIFYSNNSFWVVDIRALNNESCLAPLHNFTLHGTPFEFGDNHFNLFFYYNCSNSPPANHLVYPVTCASNNTSHLSFAMFVYDGQFGLNLSLATCQSVVRAPIDTTRIQFKEQNNYREILKERFLLQWKPSNCIKCEGSGGRCGLYNKKFVCFCHDGRHRLSCGDGGNNWKVPVIATSAALAFLGAGLLILFLIYRGHKKRKFAAIRSKDISVSSTPFSRNFSSDPSSTTTDLEKASTYFGVPIFSYDELEEATNNFDSTKELGDGGFGTVYHGKLRDGRVVAVKRLYENNYKRVEQFMNEVEILTRLRHQNLVTLYGCTSRRSRELILVYEYIPNGTVADHLHGDRAKAGGLPWSIRMSISIETASALSYLHASDIIHRDVKTNNILLDNNFGVKVADFGLSRLFPTDVTHVSTAPQGTPGYVDPEYHQCYQLTDKSDVYSFGVVLIELISSKPAVDITRHRHEINLANMAINRIQNRTLHELIDPCLNFESDHRVRRMATAVAELAFRCLQFEREMRPTMDEVLEVLNGIQSEEDGMVAKTEEADIPSDDVGLLKKGLSPPSPDSVVNYVWESQKTTPNTSS